VCASIADSLPAIIDRILVSFPDDCSSNALAELIPWLPPDSLAALAGADV
jgi:hypothetical protein